jgi:hypothetical protein
MATFISLFALKFVAVLRHPLPKYFHLSSEMDSPARDGSWLKTDRRVSEPTMSKLLPPSFYWVHENFVLSTMLFV